MLSALVSKCRYFSYERERNYERDRERNCERKRDVNVKTNVNVHENFLHIYIFNTNDKYDYFPECFWQKDVFH